MYGKRTSSACRSAWIDQKFAFVAAPSALWLSTIGLSPSPSHTCMHQVMGDHLVQENLVESEGRDRLPSPQELQGKILLKGSYRKVCA